MDKDRALLLIAGRSYIYYADEKVTISGSDRYTPQQIENILFSGRWGNNTILALINDKTKPQTDPFVEDYKIVFMVLLKVEVIVYDKSIVGYVSYMSSYMYFDREGIIVEKLYELPSGIHRSQVWNLDALFVQTSSCKGIRKYLKILNLTQQLSVYNIQVDRIRFSISGQPSLYHWPDGSDFGRWGRCRRKAVSFK